MSGVSFAIKRLVMLLRASLCQGDILDSKISTLLLGRCKAVRRFRLIISAIVGKIFGRVGEQDGLFGG